MNQLDFFKAQPVIEIRSSELESILAERKAQGDHCTRIDVLKGNLGYELRFIPAANLWPRNKGGAQ